MNIKILIFPLIFFSNLSFSKGLSDFEKMLAGFPECKFNKIYYDFEKNTVDNEFFLKRNIKPLSFENDIAEYNVDEELYGIHVSKLFVPAGTLGLVFVVFDDKYSSVEAKIKKYLIYGYNEEFIVGSEDKSQKLVPELRVYDLDKNKTTLACVWP